MARAASTPAVSVCLSTHDGAAWVEQALGSVLAQTVGDLEVVVVDDASSDDSAERVRRMADDRVRIVRNPRNLGEYATWNRCLALARAPLVKFLCQDDWLHPECLERLLPPFADGGIGMAFARRRVVFAEAVGDEERAWAERARRQHERLVPLAPRNPGRALFDRALAGGFRGNPFGEPTSVMARRACFERIGGFSVRPRQMGDFEVWLRLCFFSDVAFVDRELSSYRVHPIEGSSVTAETRRSGRDWLDELWIVEGLLEHPEIRRARPGLRRLRAVETAAALRRAGRRARSNRWRLRPEELAAAREYVSHRSARRRDRPPLHPPIGPAGH